MCCSDRTEPLDVLQLGSVEEQATSVPPEVPALAEMELDGASRLFHDRLVQAKFIDRTYRVDPSLLELTHKTYVEVGIERYYVTLVHQEITQS